MFLGTVASNSWRASSLKHQEHNTADQAACGNEPRNDKYSNRVLIARIASRIPAHIKERNQRCPQRQTEYDPQNSCHHDSLTNCVSDAAAHDRTSRRRLQTVLDRTGEIRQYESKIF
jgi:hypothetical protein